MNETITFDMGNPLQSDAFRPDRAHTARYASRALIVALVVIVLCVVLALGGQRMDQGVVLVLAALLALFAFSVEAIMILGIERFHPVEC